MKNTKLPNSNRINMFKRDFFYTFYSVDCKWSDWSEWGDCSKTCGGGVQNATRVKLQEELYDGLPCDGEATRQQDCNPDQCPSI
jgi:hypothetical protein